MFTPQDLEKIPIEIQKLFTNLELNIMNDIVRRMKLNSNEITRSADWQIYRLTQIGESKKFIKKQLQEILGLSNNEINKIYSAAIKSGYLQDKKLYNMVGKSYIGYEQNKELQQLITSIKKQTNEQLYNITQTTGFVINTNGKNIFTPITQYYQDTLDKAVIGVLNGSFNYNTVLKQVIDEMTKSGLRTIDYASGRSYRVDSAARTCIMTGVNQVASKISNDNAKELETDYFEVSAHSTARPSHQLWQGKVYTSSELESVCGLGRVDGLCGANCRHSYYPFIPGISERSYTDEELTQWANEENRPKVYQGESYTSYEASQNQRRLELLMRKQKEDIKLLKEGGANAEDIIIAEARYKISQQDYVRFSKAMDLPQQMERLYTSDKVTIKGAKSLKTIENRAKKYYNGNIDEYLKDERIRKNIRDNYNKTLVIDKQNQHIKESKKYVEGKSYLTISIEEIENIITKYAGTGKIVRDKNGNFANKEKIVLSKIIGVNISSMDKEETLTNAITMHYRKTGAHIVPTKNERR